MKVKNFASEETLLADAASAIAAGKVVAWVQGPSEFGQRALGARSILADPRKVKMRRTINQIVKEREWYRPLAPSVLDEHVGDWFADVRSGENASPYMSLTASVLPERISEIPAVCHVDGTARLQTVTPGEAPLFHRLISRFYKLTGVPMVLNTSFNRKGQPIVETPTQALETLVGSSGIDHMYLGLRKVTPKPFPFPDSETGEVEPTETDLKVTVFGSPVYLSEVTASDASKGGVILKVRVQTGGSVTDDALDTERESAWLTLPSTLHFDVLLLLQAGNDDLKSKSKKGEAVPGLSLDSILPALAAITPSHCDEKGRVSWVQLKEAMRWLYARHLISFGVVVPDAADKAKLKFPSEQDEEEDD